MEECGAPPDLAHIQTFPTCLKCRLLPSCAPIGDAELHIFVGISRQRSVQQSVVIADSNENFPRSVNGLYMSFLIIYIDR